MASAKPEKMKPMCPIHQEENVAFYYKNARCEKHNKDRGFCERCLVDHKNHNTFSLEEFTSTNKLIKDLREATEKSNKKIVLAKYSSILEKIKKRKKLFLKKTKEMKKEVEKRKKSAQDEFHKAAKHAQANFFIKQKRDREKVIQEAKDWNETIGKTVEQAKCFKFRCSKTCGTLIDGYKEAPEPDSPGMIAFSLKCPLGTIAEAFRWSGRPCGVTSASSSGSRGALGAHPHCPQDCF